MLDGWKTYITVAVGALFSGAKLFHIDLLSFGLSQDQVTAAIGTFVLLAIACLRHGVSKAANGNGK